MSLIRDYAFWEAGCNIADSIEKSKYNQRGWIRAPYYYPRIKDQYDEEKILQKEVIIFRQDAISEKMKHCLRNHQFKALRKLINSTSSKDLSIIDIKFYISHRMSELNQYVDNLFEKELAELGKILIIVRNKVSLHC